MGLELFEWHRVMRSVVREVLSLEDEGLRVPRMRVACSMVLDHFRVEERCALLLLSSLEEGGDRMEADFLEGESEVLG